LVAALDLEVFGAESNAEDIIESANKGQLDMLYLLGVDDDRLEPSSDTFVVYQGHHGEKGAQIADVILPGVTFAEKSATYINIEGKIQRTNPAVVAPGCAKEDWKIIRALSGLLDTPLPFNTLEQLRVDLDLQLETKKNAPFEPLKHGKMKAGVVSSLQGDFYQTDVISRHSITLKQVSKMVKGMTS
jgi:NADH-quinone oxidoreductase subunit G